MRLLILVLCLFHSTVIAAAEEISVKDFFRGGEIENASLSPDGTLIAYSKGQEIMAGNASIGYHSVTRLARHITAGDLLWGGPRQLIVESEPDQFGKTYFWALELASDSEGVTLEDHTHFFTTGYILDELQDNPNELMLVVHSYGDKGLKSNVYKVNPRKELKYQTGQSNRLNKKFTAARYFLLDDRGRPTIGLGYVDDQPQLFQQNPNRKNWSRLWTGPKDSVFIPYSLSSDGNTLFAISNATTDRMAAVSFDMEAKSIRDVLFIHDSVDLRGLLTDPDTGEVLAVRHLEGGVSQYEFLDPAMEAEAEWISSQLNNQPVHIIDRSKDNNAYLVATASNLQPGVYYSCSKIADGCEKIASAMPWLDDVALSPTVTYTTTSTDGYNVQSLLTMPVNAVGGVPLVVMPHGGPIGVQDSRMFSGHVQWLAYNGFAVLQVNYRGSAGFGKAFKSAGLRQWGRGIEDDIEASIDLVLEKHPSLDRQRVGIFGSSYGGYSALQSIVRSPERYRCAASFAGVTDLTLLFNDSYVKRSQRAKETLIDMIGDPSTEKSILMNYSPVYNYAKLNRPVFLAHGSQDDIVDVEHSWRLRKMMKLAGLDVELHVLDNVGHGFERLSELEQMYNPLIEFLNSHLKQ